MNLLQNNREAARGAAEASKRIVAYANVAGLRFRPHQFADIPISYQARRHHIGYI